jgi:hypothetical protein
MHGGWKIVVRRVSGLALAAGLASLLAGCFVGPFEFGSRRVTTAAEEQPAAAQPRRPDADPAPQAEAPVISLSITYLERIMVPPGAVLTVRVWDADGREVGALAARTEGGPPYFMRVPLAAGTTGPLKVGASIRSGERQLMAGERSFDTLPQTAVEMIIGVRTQ